MPSADKKYDPHAFVESTSSFGDALFSGKIPCVSDAAVPDQFSVTCQT